VVRREKEKKTQKKDMEKRKKNHDNAKRARTKKEPHST
jgi:hypothetical protein